jgi:myo-inositol-1(or 4)-monophosphatase
MNYKTPKNLSIYTKTAIKAANAGGDVLKKYFNTGIKVNYKGKIDPVTIADKNSQKKILQIIQKCFPEHAILAEEENNNKITSEYCWIIDPLDGTVNFIHGVKVFSVSIALSYKGEIICGVVYAPLLDEFFVAEKGKGAYLNGKEIKVSNIKTLIKSLVVTGFPYYVQENPNEILGLFKTIITRVQGLRRLGSAAIDLCHVGCGRFEIFWEEGLKPWDVAAGSLIVKEAGGKITDYTNGNGYIFKERLLATNGKVHKNILQLIKK